MNKRKVISTLLAMFLAITMILAGVAPAFAQPGPEIRVTNFEAYADQPDVAVDSNGNVHIAYFYAEEYWGWPDYDNREIWYTMLDNNGNTLIDDTLISLDDDANSVHPAIAVDSNDMVHIVWQDYDGEYIEYTKLDPSLDDQDGDAADEPTITVVDDTDLYYNSDGYQQHPRIAVDSDDDIHIVWEDYDEYNIYYMKVDNNGNVLVAETVIRSVSSLWYSRPDVAVDSNDNAHITWNDYEYTDSYEVYYMMLDGSDGSTLIDATLITPDDDEKSKRQTIVVDAQDMVHIIWADYRSPTGYNEIFHTKLDPSRDDQDGDDADEGVITVIDDTMLTPDDEDYSAHPQSAIQYGRYIHVAWYDNYGDYSWDIYYMVLDTDGNILVPVKVLTTTNTVSYTTSKFDNQPSLDVDSNGKAHIVWCDDRTGDPEVWYTTYCPAVVVGGEVYPVNKLGILAPWIGLAVLSIGGITWFALRRRRAYR